MPALSIIVVTYRRERVLIETIEALLRLDPPADEILVVDQTSRHEPAVAHALDEWALAEQIRLVRATEPNIPAAMNLGLRLARGHIAMFVDDDVRPAPDLVRAHSVAHEADRCALIAGRVIQPWHKQGGEIPPPDPFIGCNFSLPREAALALGGFDENFTRAAYRYEAEFAHRWRAAGRRVAYAPEAWLDHLKVDAGGTRAFGHHLRTLRPDHSVGDYYYLLRTWRGMATLRQFLARPFQAIRTRHHLRRPWWIPLTLFGEARGMAWAIALALHGPRLMTPPC